MILVPIIESVSRWMGYGADDFDARRENEKKKKEGGGGVSL
jgi:hypothetical protein